MKLWSLLVLAGLSLADARAPFATRSQTANNVLQNRTPLLDTTQLRGGELFDEGLQSAISGAVVFAIIEQVVKYGFKTYNFKYPASLGACIILFASLCLTDIVAPDTASSIYDFLVPGAAILAKWFPIFFVPGLALLPLSPRIGGTLDVRAL